MEQKTERVLASIDLGRYYGCEDMGLAELILVDGDEMVRFRWLDGRTVDVPLLAMERAFNVACRASRELGPRAFGQPS